MLLTALFVLLLLLPSYLAVAYYLGLVGARLLGARDVRPPSTHPTFHLAVVIPAHNEADQIAEAIRSCDEAAYPSGLLQVVVVADNCNDATAERAERAGARCLRRTAPEAPGKGPALGWAFAQLMDCGAEAFVVLDADCRLERETLRIIDHFLRAGDRALQTNHRVTNADASPISYAAGVGRTLEYDLFFAPKSRLGLAVLLVGTGMVLHRSLLATLPWESTSCAEDTEYTVRLVQQGERIRFLANAYIRCQSVESIETLRVQRTRWAQGNIAAGHRQALRLMGTGLRRGSLRRFDLGWTLLLISRPLVLVHLAAVLVSAAMLYTVHSTPTTAALACLSAALVPLYAVYLAVGIAALGLNATRLRHLAHAPAVVLQLGKIALAALLGFGTSAWVRTPRP